MANKQLTAETMLAARQQELSRLSSKSAPVSYSSSRRPRGRPPPQPTRFCRATARPPRLTSIPSPSLPVEASSLACGLTLVTSSVLCVASQVQAVQQTMHVTTYQQEQVQETGERLAGYDVSQTTSALAGYDVLETATTSQLTGYDTSAHYPVTARVLSGYDLYVTVARTAYACPPGWSDAGNGLCYTYATGTPHQAVSPPPNADIVGSTTEYKPVWWGYYCAVFGIGCFSAPTCHFGALWCWPVNKPYTVYTVVPLIKTYASGAATTTYTQQYEGFSQSCPSYAYQLGITCDPVYTTQTSYQRGSLGQLSYCPAPNRYTGSY